MEWCLLSAERLIKRPVVPTDKYNECTKDARQVTVFPSRDFLRSFEVLQQHPSREGSETEHKVSLQCSVSSVGLFNCLLEVFG